MSRVTIAGGSLFGFKRQKTHTASKNYVADPSTAIAIAEAIWLASYEGNINEQKPFKAVMVENKYWQIKGSNPLGKRFVPYMEIQMSDCKVLRVWQEDTIKYKKF